jgi:exodeoxyribonuclease VII large subunit
VEPTAIGFLSRVGPEDQFVDRAKATTTTTQGASNLASVPLGSPAAQAGSDAPVSDALSIRELYKRIDGALQAAVPGEVWVSGEVRSFNVSSRGHCYIDLVDPVSARDNGSPVLKVVCWSRKWSRIRSTLDQLGIVLDTGLMVRVKGGVQLYKPRGDISFILSELDTDALLGKMAAARARLIKALVDEDLFDRNRRLSVPYPPIRVGLVASPGTEGFRDFVGQLEASGMAFDVRLAPTQVQGRMAPRVVASAIRRFQSQAFDIVVVVRGGGSKADLATFDAEPVARAIVDSDLPVWTGIGHTGDQSVADEVANRTFITPTECGQELARMATEVWRSGVERGLIAGRLARERFASCQRALDRQRRSTATGARSQLDRHADRVVHRSYNLRAAVRGQIDSQERLLKDRAADLAKSSVRTIGIGQEEVWSRARRLALLPARRLEVQDLRVDQWRRLLGAYDYQRQLDRGYSVTRDSSGLVVRSAAEVGAGSVLLTQLSDGEVESTVNNTGTATTHQGDERTESPTQRQMDEGNT